MPGGVVILPKPAVRRSITTKLPSFSLEAFDRIAWTYKSESQHTAETPAAVVRRLDKIVRSAVNLRAELLGLSEEAQGALWQGAYQVGRPDIVEQTAQALFTLSQAAKRGHNATKDFAVRPGAPAGARQVMVRSFARELKEIGLAVEAKASGNLVFLVSSVLEGYGEDTKGVRELVRDTLGKMQN